MLYGVFILECVKLCCKPCNFHIQGLSNAVYITLSNGRHKIALLAFILPHELFNASEIGIVLFTLTEGYNLMGYLINVCRGKLFAAFRYNKIFYVVLLYSFLITLLFLCIVALVIIVCCACVGCTLNARHHVPAFTAK